MSYDRYFVSESEQSLVFRNELDMLADKASGRLRLHHVLSEL